MGVMALENGWQVLNNLKPERVQGVLVPRVEIGFIKYGKKVVKEIAYPFGGKYYKYPQILIPNTKDDNQNEI